MYYSALARAKADWLVGLNVTRALTVKYQDNLSAGRVQTPTLAMVRQQEKRLNNLSLKLILLSRYLLNQKKQR